MQIPGLLCESSALFIYSTLTLLSALGRYHANEELLSGMCQRLITVRWVIRHKRTWICDP